MQEAWSNGCFTQISEPLIPPYLVDENSDLVGRWFFSSHRMLELEGAHSTSYSILSKLSYQKVLGTQHMVGHPPPGPQPYFRWRTMKQVVSYPSISYGILCLIHFTSGISSKIFLIRSSAMMRVYRKCSLKNRKADLHILTFMMSQIYCQVK